MSKAFDSEIPKHRSSKDTKRWCGGKPGRLHDYQYEEYLITRRAGPWDGTPPRSVLRCTKCRKFRSWDAVVMPLRLDVPGRLYGPGF